jgi:poly(beta-D-mannuronate) lyase
LGCFKKFFMKNKDFSKPVNRQSQTRVHSAAMIRCFALFLIASLVSAKEVPVADAKAFAEAVKQAKPGDTFVLSAGEWPDVQMRFHAEGTMEHPVTLKAATAGKTIFTGESRLQISGHHLIVEGLWFREPLQGSGEVIELRTDYDELASNCLIRNCAVTSSKPVDPGKKTSRFCSVYGSDNVIEHCHFEGKNTEGTTLVVWLTPGGEGRHLIRDNFFGSRPELGKNGGETIRIGDSKTHDQNAKCEITGNLFYRCNGEGEIISVKSCENRLANNTFIECEGALTLRHAHRCLVEGNLFAGNHNKNAGGIRIVGEDHVVRNNWIENCDGDEYRCALTFMNGIFKTDDSGYQQVKRALLDGNTVLDSKFSLLIGKQYRKNCTAPPIDCVIRNNIFISPGHQLIELRTQAPGWKWENNVMIGKTIGIEGLPGVHLTKPELKRPKELTRSETGTDWMLQK